MNCKNIESRLSAYVDRELTGQEMDEVRGHLQVCGTCRAEERSYRELKQLLGGVSTVEPPAGLEDRLIHGVFSEDRVPAAAQKRPAYFLASLAAAAAMAATLLLLPGTPRPHAAPLEATTSNSNDYALEINRDQLYEASSDPLSGGHLASSAVYGR